MVVKLANKPITREEAIRLAKAELQKREEATRTIAKAALQKWYRKGYETAKVKVPKKLDSVLCVTSTSMYCEISRVAISAQYFSSIHCTLSASIHGCVCPSQLGKTCELHPNSDDVGWVYLCEVRANVFRAGIAA